MYIYIYMDVYIYRYVYIYLYTCICYTSKCISLMNNMSQCCTSCYDRSVVIRSCPWLHA